MGPRQRRTQTPLREGTQLLPTVAKCMCGLKYSSDISFTIQIFVKNLLV